MLDLPALPPCHTFQHPDRLYTADQMHQYARDYAASQTAVVAEPGRYFAGGPQGHFFADDLQLARDLVNLYDKDDDWTITDLRNPTGAAPAASGGEDAASVSERARIDALALDVAHRFTQDTEPQRRASLQVAVIAAIEQALTQQRGEPNGKLVGWWNGIMPDVTERSPYGPSVRWGADAENSGHDIPLYDGYNPIHYTTPQPSADAVREDDNG